MTAIKVTKDYFQGSGRIWDRQVGLAVLLRGLAIDNARLALAVASVTDFVDNSTGVAAATVVDVTPPTDVIDASASAVGSPKAGLDTALGKLDDAFAVLAENINKARTRLGLPVLTYSGTVAVSGTVPACDKTLTAVSGASAATKDSVNTALTRARNSLASLTYAVNEVFTAIGQTVVASAIGNHGSISTDLVDIGITTASATGADAASDTVVDTALTAIVANVATLASKWNTAMSQASQPITPLNVIAG